MICGLGFIQGRLSPRVDGLIQAFPKAHWQSEFKIAQQMGLQLMEWTLDDEGISENPFIKESLQPEVKALCEKYSVKIPSITGDFFMQNPFFKANGVERLTLIERLITVIRACQFFGTKIIVIPLVDNASIGNPELEQLVIEEFKKLVPILNQCNVQIAIESDFRPQDLSKFIDKLPAENFGINYDIGNSASLGFDPSEEFAAYSNRIFNVHVKDRLLHGTTVPLGKGNADLPLVMDLIRRARYSGNLIMQTARADDDDHSAVMLRYKNQIEYWMK
jgi:L-ribulose-5-phosphate 3-epimerase